MTTSPAPDELEVTVFGPGYGECVVVHLGGGDWAVIDSCRSPRSEYSDALTYLDELGVDVASAVKRIIVSHWHDDHVRGLGMLVARARSAVVCISNAMNHAEFNKAFARAREAGEGGEDTHVSELGLVFETLKRRLLGRPNSRGPSWIVANRRLYARPADSDRPAAEMLALSPADGTMTSSYRALAEVLEGRRPTRIQPNDTAVALHVRVGSHVVLLGSDLEVSTDVNQGWHAVLALDPPPQDRASTYKVAHHGSVTGQHDGIWDRLLEPAPTSIVTPFTLGRVMLPTPTDLARIRARSASTYLTSPPKAGKVPKYGSSVDRTIREVAGKAAAWTAKYGRVTLRAGPRGVVWQLDGEAHEHLASAN